MDSHRLFERYQELQGYVGWSAADANRIVSVADLLRPYFSPLVDDFYTEIERHPEARKVITGGPAQIARLKGTLVKWLDELVSGQYDLDYVARRWRVGWRHVEIGLDQVFTNVALSRLKTGLFASLDKAWNGDPNTARDIRMAIGKLVDLDLAIIEDAYQTEFHLRQQRSERLAAIGKIAGGIAHELRNPLNVVKTSVYYLRHAKNPSEEKQNAHLERIDRQVMAADSVITALNNFARLPIPDLKPIDITALLKEVLELNTLPESVPVTMDCPPSLPHVLGDADQLQIVFGNLIRNARDAMSKGGVLTISAQHIQDNVEVAVNDTGVGIPSEDFGRIMEPLYSTKSRGIGLGLAIVRAILEKHNGTLQVKSEVNRGTTMRVCLTAAASDKSLQGVST